MTKEQILSDALAIRRQFSFTGSYWNLEACIESVIEHNRLKVRVDDVMELYELRVLKLN
jgi:hypothetical protein